MNLLTGLACFRCVYKIQIKEGGEFVKKIPDTHLNIVQGLREIANDHNFVCRTPAGLLEDSLKKAAEAAHLPRVVPEGG